MKLRCRFRGHDWFPEPEPREFTATVSVCVRCPAMLVQRPWGTCLGGHPLADHYTPDGEPVPVRWCRSGGPL